ncbi:MAG: YbjQ family protein [Planctomycetota bacterium]|jgi:uncharacterized protein YbjQ (UPF0145 family)
MFKGVRLVGSTVFVIGFFVLIFVAIPWLVTVVNDPTIGGPLPWWVKGAVYCFIGGVAIVLISIAAEQAMAGGAAGESVEISEVTDLVVTNNDCVLGREVADVLGLVQGHTIYAIWIGRDISALVKLLLGGELTEYTEMMGKARGIAMQRMLAQAKEKGADAVINVRLMTTSVVGTAAELLVYGTAVKLASA